MNPESSTEGAPRVLLPGEAASKPQRNGTWHRFLRSTSRWIPAAAAALHLALVLAIQGPVLHAYPASGDEYAYLVSAQIFSHGELSVPSPPSPRFFDVVHVVNDGKFYGKYPPGWPALLAVGFGLGRPWWVNPLLGIAALLAVYATARRHWGVEAANLSLLLLAPSPWFVFQGASYFSHTSCLLAVVLALDRALVCVAGGAGAAAFAMLGATAGAAFTIRPFTAVAMMLPVALVVVAKELNTKETRAAAKHLAFALLPFLVFVALLLAYNEAQTGHALLSPFSKYNPKDGPGLPGATLAAWASRAWTHVVLRLWELNLWAPLLPLLFAIGACSRRLRRDPKVRLLVASSLALLVAYYFYWAEGGVRYGPRYVFEAAGALVLVASAWLAGVRRGAAALVALVLLLDGAAFAAWSRTTGRYVRWNTDLVRKAAETVKAPAVVFVKRCPGRSEPTTCTRNGTDFRAPVLFVQDRGEQDNAFLAQFPGRRAWVYETSPEGRLPMRLDPYDSEAVAKPAAR